MISVEEALQYIHSNLFTPRVETVKLTSAVGRVLSEPIYADRDFPPFDRVMMDGIAIHYESFKNGQRTFDIEGAQYAGMPQQVLKNNSNALEIMTGAMLPKGTDTVIRYEDFEVKDGKAIINIENVSKGQNVHLQGTDETIGSILLEKGSKIGSPEIGILASVGKTSVDVFTIPKMAIISTGDELVDINKIPEPYQVRRSNSYTIQSNLKEFGCTTELFHLHDDKRQLEEKLGQLMNEFDVFILSGGVSRGKKDYLPEVLESLGINKLFHRVAQRPGKPFWFGRNDQVTVFALPGNPVSTFFCYQYYVKSWLKKSIGITQSNIKAKLMTDVQFQPALTYYLEVDVRIKDSIVEAFPVKGNGSGDLTNLKNANGFMELPADRTEFKKGEEFSVILFRSLN